AARRPASGAAVDLIGGLVKRLHGIRLLACLAALMATSASAQTLTRGPLIQKPDALTTTMTLIWWTDVAGNSTVEYGTTTGLGSCLTGHPPGRHEGLDRGCVS